MLQSTAPATKCHTGAAPATQRHNSTYHSLHQPPRPTLQRYQGLQSTAPATKCHTGAAPATQRHTATHPSLHQPPRATLQRYQDASIDCACHQMSHWCCACHTTSQFNVPFPAPATQTHTPTLPGTSIDCACHQMSPATQRHTATHPSLHQPPKATLQRYQDASITCHQMSHWCCACHTTSHCNVHATYHSLHQPPRATLQRYQDASIDCACHQMSHWCCACHTTSQFNVPFPAPATQIHAATGSVPTCTSEPISHVQASQFHVYKRTRARNPRILLWKGLLLRGNPKLPGPKSPILHLLIQTIIKQQHFLRQKMGELLSSENFKMFRLLMDIKISSSCLNQDFAQKNATCILISPVDGRVHSQEDIICSPVDVFQPGRFEWCDFASSSRLILLILESQ